MGILELLFGSKETNNKKKTKAEIEKEKREKSVSFGN